MENDIVLMHGRWCLDRLAPREFLTRDTFARERIEAIMNKRRTDLTNGTAVYCEGATI